MTAPGTRRMPVAAERAAARPPDAQRELLRRLPLAGEFDAALAGAGLFPLRPSSIKVLQVNVGKLCNQTCRHCHVDAGPDRREIMSRTTLSQCVRAVGEAGIPIVDITGGAPELNPHFRWFVSECRKLGAHVIDRCNLTVLTTQKHQDLPEFFATHQVEVVASLPHYLKLSTDRQRGDGVHERSIEALLALNGVGYAREGSGLRLVLVTNPVGAFLPGNQASLEKEWKRELLRLYGVRFDALFTITNMPISRYLEWLLESGNLESYLQTLVSRFNAQAARAVMCRSMISVGWDGYLYDCDFNQMLELPVAATAPRHIADFDAGLLLERDIVVDRHCFGCTAGAGSSCGGATAAGEERPA